MITNIQKEYSDNFDNLIKRKSVAELEKITDSIY